MRGLLLAACALAAACATTSAAGPAASAHSETDFVLPDVGGRDVRLSDFAGRVVVVDFWATWCTPCVAALPALEELSRRYADQGLTVLGVAIDGPETVATVGPFARRTGVTFPVLLDEESRVVSTFNPSRTVPFQLIVDRHGRVVRRRQGYSPGDEKLLEAELAALLAAP